jgi:RNA polymerase sigma-70 factor (ECF subfamily)
LADSPPDFDQLYTLYARFIWRALRSMGVHASALPDAVQDVFIVVHRRYPEFDHRHKVRTWLFEIAYRIAREHRRKYARVNTMFVAQEPERELVAEHSPADEAEQKETVRVLARLLDKLDDDKREVLVLAEIEGLTAPEIAQVTSVPLNTVYSRLRRARAEFSELVAMQQRRAE